jgi:hypothetical protein
MSLMLYFLTIRLKLPEMMCFQTQHIPNFNEYIKPIRENKHCYGKILVHYLIVSEKQNVLFNQLL